MNLLPVEAGRFRLVDVGDDDALRSEVCKRMVRSHARSLAGKGMVWRPCRAHPEPNVFLHMNVEIDGADDGGFMLYDMIALSDVDGVLSVSCVPASVLDSEPGSDEWIDDMAEILSVFLSGELDCEGGEKLSVVEFRFPSVSEGALPEHEWVLGAERPGVTNKREGDPDRVALFLSKMGDRGITISLSETDIPIRAFLTL